MQEAEEILGRFPGPVTLYPGRGKVVLGLLFSLGLLIFCSFYVSGTFGPLGIYDTIMGWLSVVVFAGLLARSLILLLVPGTARLTLDAEGFEIGRMFSRNRFAWRDASNFRQQVRLVSRTAFTEVAFETTRGGGAKVTEALPSNYGLSYEDLVQLMQRWDERATGRKRPSAISAIRNQT
jgi:hypothetical protein